MNSSPDESLVLASKRGDKRAYTLLVQEHYRHIFLLCIGILGNVHDAEDAAQEAFLKGFTEIQSLQHASRRGAVAARESRVTLGRYLGQRSESGSHQGTQIGFPSRGAECPRIDRRGKTFVKTEIVTRIKFMYN